MPKGPNGQTRPPKVIEATVMVAKIATGEIEDSMKSGCVRSGVIGSAARASSLSPVKAGFHRAKGC
uniref:Uncharacterized protein n=1 Tax=Candidatus Kentrum sp. UNK TaxID=2126344 RepID=A0A451A7Q1_9GAMM|nr:MAG: hypothetical protein BECKUNK1418G_GA0071005_102124 [Candidatus Kentron sp. UNK]VFK70357.1 MAG: hypothetical protein BECKUNK1418H_GA0071006_102724 [Candidatus Kentron sp. UNK]